MKLWRYLYYIHVKIARSFKTANPSVLPALGTTLILCFNLLSVLNAVSIAIGVPIVYHNKIARTFVLLVAFAVQWFFFVRNKRYETVMKEFEHENQQALLADIVLLVGIYIGTAIIWSFLNSTCKEIFLLKK